MVNKCRHHYAEGALHLQGPFCVYSPFCLVRALRHIWYATRTPKHAVDKTCTLFVNHPADISLRQDTGHLAKLINDQQALHRLLAHQVDDIVRSRSQRC